MSLDSDHNAAQAIYYVSELNTERALSRQLREKVETLLAENSELRAKLKAAVQKIGPA